MKNIYISTPVYYVNGKPHIGHAYTTVIADFLKRYFEQRGHRCFLLTGTDEHGKKILRSSQENKQDVVDFVEDNVTNFKKLWDMLNIDYSVFTRTTNQKHEDLVKEVFSSLYKTKEIYEGNYEGFYCVKCEDFFTKKFSTDNQKCINCNGTLQFLNEEVFFLKVTNKREWIINLYKKNPRFLIPEKIKNELFNNFIDNDLSDLCVSRKKNGWGIETPISSGQEIYVWFDALLSYLSGFKQLKSESQEIDFWNDENIKIQIIGKEISRFHGLYWPILLDLLNKPQPNVILAHDWILFQGEKMSKSRGNIIDPNLLINKYGSDALRFFLLKEITISKGGKYSEELLVDCINNNLVNEFGNLFSRTIQMIIKYANGIIPESDLKSENTMHIKKIIMENKIKVENFWKDYFFSKGINELLAFIRDINKIIEDQKPWTLFKTNNKTKLNNLLNLLANCLLYIGWMFSPVLVDSWEKICEQLGILNENIDNARIENFGFLSNKKVKRTSHLFERINN